ncbi:MAG: phosphocholine cytidylyltransferase family protein [Kofleriaceae bacterium]|jgi:choline kinase|nr:phosphocholine cytidylyltransferase family protein [Kofleriaceae bacterium]
MKAVILAAGVGSRLAPLTNDRPKALVPVNGTPILFRHLASLARAGIPATDVIVVGGYKLDVLRRELAQAGFGAVTIVENERFEPWNNFWSLYVAEPALRGHDFLQIDGDALLDDKILPRLMAAPGQAALAVDCRDELDDETMKVQVRPGTRSALAISKKLPAAACVGEYIGLTKITAAAAPVVFRELLALRDEGLTHEYYEHAYHRLTGREEVVFGVVDVHDCTVTEIDNVEDLARADAMLRAIEGAR